MSTETESNDSRYKMGDSARVLQKCCRIRKKNIPDVVKKSKISILLATFTRTWRGSMSFCPSCVNYIKPEVKFTENLQSPLKKKHSSSPGNPSTSRTDRSPWDTIIVDGDPVDFDHELLTSLFSKYGPIKDIYCSNNSRIHRNYDLFPTTARVRFRHEADARSVWEASREAPLTFGGQIVRITLVSKDYSPIESLPDDCLRHIFYYLDVEDKLTLEWVSRRWQRIGAQSWSNVVTITEDFTSTCWRIIAPRVGKSLQNLVLLLPEETTRDPKTNEDSCCETVALVAEHLSSLRLLSISRTPHMDEAHWQFFERIPHLETIISRNQDLRVIYLRYAELDRGFFEWLPRGIEEIYLLSNCTDAQLSLGPVDLSAFVNLEILALSNYEIPRNQLEGIENLTNLKTLTFDGSNVHGSNIEKIVHLRKLQRLSICNCQIFNVVLSEILQNNPNLVYLDISDIRGVDNSTFQHVFNLKNLRTLVMMNLTNVTRLAPMPCLEHLNINGCCSLGDAGVQPLFTPNSLISRIIMPKCRITLHTLAIAYGFSNVFRDRADSRGFVVMEVDPPFAYFWERCRIDRELGYSKLRVKGYDSETNRSVDNYWPGAYRLF